MLINWNREFSILGMYDVVSGRCIQQMLGIGKKNLWHICVMHKKVFCILRSMHFQCRINSIIVKHKLSGF